MGMLQNSDPQAEKNLQHESPHKETAAHTPQPVIKP